MVPQFEEKRSIFKKIYLSPNSEEPHFFIDYVVEGCLTPGCEHRASRRDHCPSLEALGDLGQLI